MFPGRGIVLLGVLALLGSLFGAHAADATRIPLARQHVDFRIRYEPGTTNELFAVIHDGDAATNYASTNVLLIARPPSEIVLPEGFPELGEPGSPLWILPGSQDPELLYLGVSGEGLPPGTFEGPLRVRLVEVRSPGDFMSWQYDSDGTVRMFLDSRNGVGPEDFIPVSPRAHGHYYWGFSSNGFCQVTLRVEGRLVGASTNLLAADTPFLFAVEPLPAGIPTPARLDVAAVRGDVLELKLSGTPGYPYAIATSPDLSVWNPREPVTAAKSPVSVFVELPPQGAPLLVRATSSSL